MKKRLWILALAVSLSLAACSVPPESTPADVEGDGNLQSFFSGEVLELGTQTFLVRVTDAGNCGVSDGSEVHVPRETASTGGCPELTVGQPVRVVFDGEILESYPLRLRTVFAIYRMDSEGHCITPEGTVDFGPLPHDIHLTVKAVSPTGLTLVCSRAEEDGQELWTDSLFVIERMEEASGHWVEVLRQDLNEPLVWDDMAYTIPSDGTTEWELRWQTLYGALPTGIYRVVKTIYTQSSEASVCYAGFSISD